MVQGGNLAQPNSLERQLTMPKFEVFVLDPIASSLPRRYMHLVSWYPQRSRRDREMTKNMAHESDRGAFPLQRLCAVVGEDDGFRRFRHAAERQPCGNPLGVLVTSRSF